MPCRSGQWRTTSRHGTTPGNFPRCSQVQHTLRQKTGRELSRRKDGHLGYCPASRCSRIWTCSLFPHRPTLPAQFAEPHGIGAVRVLLRHRDTGTETARPCSDLQGSPEPTTGNLCTSCNAAGAGTSTARTVRTSFSAAARYARAASQGWSTEQLPRVHCFSANSCFTASCTPPRCARDCPAI